MRRAPTMAAFSGKQVAHSGTEFPRNATALLLLFALAAGACGQRDQAGGMVWMNPQVENHCIELARVLEHEDLGSEASLPDDFSLPDGAAIAGAFPGDPPVVHVTADGDFLAIDSFFKAELENEGWGTGSSGNGSDPSGRFGYVNVGGHGWTGQVRVIQCGEADPEILVELEPKRNTS